MWCALWKKTKIPTVILATLGVLQGSHVRQVIDRPGVYMINSPDNLEAVESGLTNDPDRCSAAQRQDHQYRWE